MQVTSTSSSLRYEERATVSVSLTESTQTLTADDFDLDGLEIVQFTAQSAVQYQIEVRSTAAAGEASIVLGQKRVTDAAGNSNSRASGFTFQIDPRPPLAYEAAYKPLQYAPEMAYSYYSPGTGTFNVYYSDDDPIDVQVSGQPFPSGMIVMVQFQKALVNFDRDGTVRWTFPSGGRFVTVDGSDIFVSDLDDLRKVHILDGSGQVLTTLAFDREVNFVKASGDRLLVVYNDFGPAEVYAWSQDHILGERVFSSAPVRYARSADLAGDQLAIADTFGQRVIVQSLQSGELIESYAVAYPNDVSWRGSFLYVVEEHIDRIVAFNTVDTSKHVVMAPPVLTRWDLAMSLDGTPPEFCGTSGQYRRSISSDLCSGELTLYAPNGFHLAEDGIWVADTDNARVIYVAHGAVQSVITGLNGPVNVSPYP